MTHTTHSVVDYESYLKVKQQRDELLQAAHAAELCLQSIERNTESILHVLHRYNPALHVAAVSTFAGWRRNLQHSRDAIKATEDEQ